jgi:hypothetical protein
MVINQINISGVSNFIEAENKPIITGYINGIKTIKITLDRVQSQSWEIHIRSEPAGVQPCQ